MTGSAVVTVNPTVVPGVGVSASPGTTVCIVTPQIIFTASPTNGGAVPIYAWFTNGVTTGITTEKYTNSTPANGDQVYVVMTSTTNCPSPSTATSITNTVTVTSSVAPGVGLTVTPSGPICGGTQVIFTATPTNGGTPTYVWYTNGSSTLVTTVSYTNSSLVDNDQVYVVMTSTDPCASPSSATSITNAADVTPTVTPSVSVGAAPGSTVCAGTTVIFTATPVNGGTPFYQWKSNSVNVGVNSATYTNSTLAVGSTIIACVITPSPEVCASPSTASNFVSMTVSASVTPSVTIAPSPSGTNCYGTEITFTATPVNGGATPSYQWKSNGVNVGANSPTYSSAVLTNGDVVSVVLTPSTEICVSPTTASAATNIYVNVFSLVGGSPITIFTENMGTTASGNPTVGSFTGWQNTSPITFSSTSTGQSDVRTSTPSTGYAGSSGNDNVFMGTSGGNDKNFIIGGINTIGYSALQLQFGLRLDSGTASFVVEVSPDGTTWTQLPTIAPTPSGTWSLTTASGATIPATSNLRIRFSKNSNGQYRIDDVKLTGLALAPTNASITASGPTTINYGSSVALTALAGGTSYQWLTNGVFNGVTSASLIATNSGTYTVVITDSRGCSSSASTNVTVFDPVITAQPVGVTNAPGEDVSFSATAIGTPTLTYQWLTNGVPVADGGNISGAQTSTLNLTAITSGNVGSYSVIVSNGLGNAVTSSVAPLVIIDPVITLQPVSLTNLYGTTASFTVTGVGSGTLSYQWRTNGVNLTDVGNYAGTTTDNLVISSVVFANTTTNLTVVVTSDAGSITSVVVSLTVIDPIIVAQPTSQTNVIGTTAAFTVSAAGTPTVTYQWQTNGVAVVNGGRFSGATSASLSIANVNFADATSSYSVVVGGIGTAVTSSVVSLTVLQDAIELAGTNYFQNFNDLANGLPIGWYVRTNASASSLGTNVSFVFAPTNDWGNFNFAFRNYASTTNNLGAAAAGNEDNAIQNGFTNRGPGVRLTSLGSDPSAAFIMQVSNTLGRFNFSLALDLNMLDVEARSSIWTIDYGFGTNPTSFTVLGTYGDPGAFGTTPTNFTFGSALDNNSSNIWIRVVTLSPSTGSGSRDTFGIDNVSLGWRTNTPPTALSVTSNCTPGLSLAIQITGAGGIATDADGDTLNVTTAGFSPEGTNQVFTAGSDKYIYYQNTNAGAASDSFTYTVTDGFGGSDTKTITINMIVPTAQIQGTLFAPEIIGGGPELRLKLLGYPGYDYAVEWATNLSTSPWVPLGTNQADGTGLLIYTNSSPTPENYYRTRWVP